MNETRIQLTQPDLPEGYVFTDKRTIQPQEIIDLREAANWGGDTIETWQRCIDQAEGSIVGVRDNSDTLLGMGRITDDPRHAVFCDLAVHPEHRQQGIGRAILIERTRIADERRIPYLYTNLAPDNPLGSVYREMGFVAVRNGLFLSRALWQVAKA